MTDANKLEGSTAPKPKPPNAGKGRPKGVPNKSTAAVKGALTEAFEKLGGVEALVAWGTGNPTDFYKLWAKMMPTEVTGADGGPIQTEALDALAALPKAKRDGLRAAIKAAMES